MEALIPLPVDGQRLTARPKSAQTDAGIKEVRPIDVVKLSERKAGPAGNNGAMIDETVGSDALPAAVNNETINLEEVAQAINEYLKSADTDIRIEIHKATHQPIFKIIRADDKAVIKEIPPKEALDLIKRIEVLVGSLCDCKV